jgi:hypothetical protein
MFLHTYTFATDRIPLVLEELSLCRNLHQVQGIHTEKAPNWESVKGKRREEAQLDNQTWANPHQHRGPNPESSPPREGEAGPGHPRRWRARGTAVPPSYHLAPLRAGGLALNRGWQCGGVFGEYSPPKPTRQPLYKKMETPSLTHTI